MDYVWNKKYWYWAKLGVVFNVFFPLFEGKNSIIAKDKKPFPSSLIIILFYKQDN